VKAKMMRNNVVKFCLAVTLSITQAAYAASVTSALPDAPQSQTVPPSPAGSAQLGVENSTPSQAAPAAPQVPAQQPGAPQLPAPPAQVPAPPQSGVIRLTLKQAEQLALSNNPQISVARLLMLAQGQVTREVRSSELPFVTGNLTAVEPHYGSRIAAGALNNPIIYQRAAGGVNIGQLITDFGRTINLVSSARLREKAQVESQRASSLDIILATDQAFYTALQAQALLNVAKSTVAERQITADQVQALTMAKLKSELDLSFANVNLAQAKLALIDAENQKDAAFAYLNTILGFEMQQSYLLVDETSAPVSAPPANVEALLAKAFQFRPDLASLENQFQSAERFRRAEHDLYRPTISALAVVGGAPVRSDQFLSSWYGAAGVNMSIPIFNGFLFSARAREADYRSGALQQQVRDLRNHIARDVNVTWLQANSAYQRIAVAAQLLQQANLALDLAQTRYTLGLGNIVELSQAQLQQTQAQIDSADARYAYLSALSALAFQTGL
jgi:outer membrane protein